MNEELLFKLTKIPHSTGIYKWLGKDKQILYIGKAKDLFVRVHQYFDSNVSIKTKELINNVYDIDFIVTKNENDALILENSLIIQYKPKFNILLKENNNYPFIILTDEKNPRLIYTRNFNKYSGIYYGPLASSIFKKYDLYKLLQEIFPLRKCEKIPNKKCLYYDMKLCVGPCINDIENSFYENIKKQVQQFFDGKKQIIKNLVLKEKKEVKLLNFEQAQKYKVLIESIKHIKNFESIIMLSQNEENIDVIGIYEKNSIFSLIIHRYRKNVLFECSKYIEEYYDNLLEDSISSLLNLYYLENKNKPKKIYSSFIFFSLIPLFLPKKSKYSKIVENANENAKSHFQSNYLVFQKLKERTRDALKELEEILNISNINLIHSFDISNFFENDKVGAMIVLENGEFNKKLYRKFIIKNVEIKGDYWYLEEVVRRQYRNMIQNDQQLPNLIIVDGGIIQVNSVKKVLEELKLNELIMVVGLSKDDKHKTNALVLEKETIILNKKSGLYFFLYNIQEEVHRFAISFFTKKHSEKFIK